MSKSVFVFDVNSCLPLETLEKIRENIKKQISDGVVFLDDNITFNAAFNVEPDGERVEFVEKRPGKLKITRRAVSEIGIKELKEAISSGNGRDVIQPFDEIEFTLTTGERVAAVCGYVDEHKARFVLKDCLREPWKMNEEATNKGGYLKSEARRHVLEDILPTFPEELRSALAPRSLSEEIDGETNEYADTLWLPSATDVFGGGEYWEEEPDSFQLEIFKRERDRVKEREDYGTAYWWLRSPYASYSNIFVIVYTDGTVYTSSANYSYGFAPGFDL